MSTHIITVPLYLRDDTSQANEINVAITYTYIKGAPEQGPSYASGGQPADPDEIEFVSAVRKSGAELAQDEIDKLAREHLESSDGFSEALLWAAEGWDR